MDIKILHKELIKSFFLSFKRLSLYSVEHPLSKEILNNLFKTFAVFLKDNPEILITAGISLNEIRVNDNILDKDTVGAGEIYAKFKGLKLDGLSFQQGLTFEELADFVNTMAKVPVLDTGKAVVLPVLLQNGTEHIKIKKIRYEKVDEDEAVVSKDKIGTGPGGGAGGAGGIGGSGGTGGTGIILGEKEKNIFLSIKDFLTGKSQDITAQSAGIFTELENNVSEISGTIIDSIKESGDFEGVINKFVGWLSKNVTVSVVEKKRDPAKFIEKLFDSFKKEDLGVFSSDKSAVIEQCEDDVKMAVIADAILAHRDSPKKAVNFAAKILSDEEYEKRILPKLTQKLIEQGISNEECNSFVQKVETELAKDEEVVISKKKLHRLMRLSDKFEEELQHKVRTATEGLTKVNKKLALEKERSEGVMRHLADGLVVVDKTGKIVMMNPAAEKLLDREMKESLGKSLVEGLKDEHVMAVAKGSLDDKDETHITREIELTGKDENTKRVLRASSAVVENEDGNTVGMVSVLSDITREKEVDEIKSHFVSLVTHELRTPVVAIQKSLELILSKATGAINEDQERFLSISKFNLERLNRLINDLLDMSKLEAGKLAIKAVSFDFRDIVKEVCDSLANWAKDKRINIKLDLKEEVINVSADRDRMVQVLTNLMGNALKFTPEKGEISIILNPLECKEGICAENCLEVIVTDTGIGIELKDFKRIFNKFEQVTLVSPSGTGGSGLGLPIAKEIVNLHGGVIWVESKLGGGSKFIFVIPRVYKKN